MDHRMNGKELISELADGRLQGAAFAQAVEACAASEARATWHAYHVIGEVLRSADAGTGRSDADFVGKLSVRLAQEQPARPAAAPPLPAQRLPAANDETFRWKMVAGVASFAAVGAIGWSLVAGSAPARPQMALAPQAPASAPTTVLARAPGGAVMIRDAKLDELLAAHRQLGGVSALQMPAGFVRNATFDNHGR